MTMQSCGVKRPLSDIDVQEIQEDSPEYLLPVKDPYSSDDDKLRKSVRVNKKSSRDNVKREYTTLALAKNNLGSEYTGEQSYFYQSVQFKRIAEEVSLEDASICECLVYLFKFSSSKFFNEKECTWKGEQIVDLLNRETETLGFPGSSWLLENDNIDWKTASPEKRSEIENLIAQTNCDINLHTNCELNSAILNIPEAIKDLYEEIYCQYIDRSMEEKCCRKNKVMTCVESMASFVSPVHYIRSGNCEENFGYYVPEHLVSENSPLVTEGREVNINSRPDGVFTFPYSNTRLCDSVWKKLWLIPVQAYVPKSEEITSLKFSRPASSSQFGFLPQEFCPKKKDLVEKRPELKAKSPDSFKTVEYFPGASDGERVPSISSTKAGLPPKASIDALLNSSYVHDVPKTSIDALLNSSYVHDVQNYISEALPIQCRGPSCRDKMAGEHIQQLLAVAKQITTEQKTMSEEGVLEVLGLFLVNEYVYFSRLDIEKQAVYYISDAAYKLKANTKFLYKEFESLDMPSAIFSNFRLDLTIAKHRLALMIFIKNYQLAFFNKKI